MIDRAVYERFDRALGACSEVVEASVRSMLEELAPLSGDALEAAIAERYAALVEAFGQMVAVAAVELYQQVRGQASLPTSYTARTFLPDNAGSLAFDVRESLSSSGGGMSGLPSRASRRALEYADETLMRNAQADPAHPRWALVPHADACGWCRLMASQGFSYSSEATAMASRHDHCRCTPVVDFDHDAPGLDGYDDAALREEYRRARSAVEEDARSEWGSMSKEERASYGSKGRGAYDHYLRNRIVAEMGKS